MMTGNRFIDSDHLLITVCAVSRDLMEGSIYGNGSRLHRLTTPRIPDLSSTMDILMGCS